MNQFLRRQKLPKLTQEETDNPNSPVSINEMEPMISNLPQNKSPDPGGFTD